MLLDATAATRVGGYSGVSSSIRSIMCPACIIRLSINLHDTLRGNHGTWFPLPSHHLCSARADGDDMDRSQEVWIWRGPGADRRCLESEVSFLVTRSARQRQRDLYRFDVPGDCSVELSPLGNQFLTDIFEAYDRVSRLTIIISNAINR